MAQTTATQQKSPGEKHDQYYLGFDIGGTKCAAILAAVPADTGPGEEAALLPGIVDRQVFATRDAGCPEEAINRLIAAARQMCSRLESGRMPAGVGISCGSPLDSRRGLILSPPNLPGWDHVAITDRVSAALKLPAWLLNDADAGALAEWRYGAGRGCQNLVFITFGTGFGAGLILNGRLYSGVDDGAGEIGHLRISPTGPVGYGKAGSLEGFCSGGGIAQLSRMMVLEKTQMGQAVAFCDAAGGPEHLTAKIVGDAADDGDELAQEILATSGLYLGQGLAILLDLLNPERIIIGSIFARSRRWIWPAADAVLQKESLARTYRRCQVLPAQLGEQIGDLAALCIAIEGKKGSFIR
jgi:glucokinase